MLFLIINIIIYKTTQINQTERINISLNHHIHKLKNHYKVLMNQQQVTADIAYDSTINDEKVMSILSEAFETNSLEQRDKLRKQFFELLDYKYKLLVRRGVLQYHFVFPDNKPFIRFHKISKYGDNLSDIRLDFKKVNETKKIIRGFAQGRTAHAFRNVYPLFDKNKKHIGAMEVSFTSEYLQENLTNISNIHTHFLVKKNIFDAKAWERDDLVLKYSKSIEHPNYMVTMPKSHTKSEYKRLMGEKIDYIQEDITKKIALGKEFALYFEGKKELEVISFLPIENNTKHDIVAWIVSYDNDQFIKNTLSNTFYIRIVLFSILSILFYSIYKILMQKYTLEDVVQNKTIDLKELNENLEQKIVIEVEKSKQIESKLFQSEKMASMGEMIGNIAHQWRQPLSAISTGATGMLAQKEYGLLTDEKFVNTCNNIDKHAQYLSQTIDDFRNYIKGDRKKTKFTLKSDIDSFLHLIEGSLKKEAINVIINIDDNTSIEGYPNELVQCFINIYNNAKDAFIEKKIDEKYLLISSKENSNTIEISIQDNAQGIEDNIISKIFEPYFTTKHKMQGTGLGLHMTYTLIVEGMSGNIEVKNKTFEYNDKIYIGAEFNITLPK